MLRRDANDQPTSPRAVYATGPAEKAEENMPDSGVASHQQPEQPSVTPASRLYPSISTERIMQAVEQQRRVSQQLEDLRLQQKQRTAFLRTSGLKVLAVLWGVFGALVAVFVVLLMLRPELLTRLIDAFSGGFAIVFMLEEELKLGLSLIPSSSWLLSGAALVVVLMMGLWIRLMRYPQEA